MTKNDGTTKDLAENLDLVMSIYNVLEYGSNYSDTTGSLWSYYKDKATNFNDDITKTNSFKYFNYKAKLLKNTVCQSEPNNNNGILKKM